MANSIRGVARRTLGVSSENVSDQKESRWWNDDVQAKVQFKKGCFTKLVSCPDGPDRHIKRELFKVAKRMAKQAVADAKAKAYQEMYRCLGTKEGVNEIFKLAKARNKRRQDISSFRYIKVEDDHVLLHEVDITARWGRYFSRLFNAARGREIVFDQEIVHVPDGDAGASQDITVAEVRAALGMMGKGKTVGLDEIPVEVWQCLSEQGVRWLTTLFNVIFRTSRMPSEWRLSVVVSIYKNKGDAQSCSNYRERRKDIHMVFIDLEKAYDSVPRAVLWRCLAAREVQAVNIRTIQDMYSAVGTCVRIPVGDT
nr:PREDICTED: uncharacterized protein LOC108207127 [Daucus carota subsp. sativus]